MISSSLYNIGHFERRNGKAHPSQCGLRKCGPTRIATHGRRQREQGDGLGHTRGAIIFMHIAFAVLAHVVAVRPLLEALKHTGRQWFQTTHTLRFAHGKGEMLSERHAALFALRSAWRLAFSAIT